VGTLRALGTGAYRAKEMRMGVRDIDETHMYQPHGNVTVAAGDDLHTVACWVKAIATVAPS
jgi:hypothetical protein